MQNLTEQDVIEIIKRYNTSQGGSRAGFTVPKHVHNGSDMLKVSPTDLLPYPVVGTSNQSIFATTNVQSPNGMFVFYDYYTSNYPTPPNSWDFGVAYRLNNEWHPLNLADYSINAVATGTQSIAVGGTASIIFDQASVIGPPHLYDPATGTFKITSTSSCYLDAIVTIDTTLGAGEIVITYQSGFPGQRTITYPYIGRKQSIHFSAIISSADLASGSTIMITNSTGTSVSTVPGESWLTLKQIK